MENRRKNGVSEAIRMAAVTHRLLTAGTVLCAAASVAASLVPPLLLARIIDGLTAGLPLTFPAVLLYFGSLALEGMLSSAQESRLQEIPQRSLVDRKGKQRSIRIKRPLRRCAMLAKTASQGGTR